MVWPMMIFFGVLRSTAVRALKNATGRVLTMNLVVRTVSFEHDDDDVQARATSPPQPTDMQQRIAPTAESVRIQS